MAEPIKMTIGASIALNEVLTKILYLDPEAEKPTERDLPLNVKYKLQKNKGLFEKDYIFFEQERNNLIKKYGKEVDGVVKVEDDKLEEYKKAVLDIVKFEVEHELAKLKPSDVEDIDVKGITADEVTLFMRALVDDPTFEKDLSTPVTLPKEEEKKD